MWSFQATAAARSLLQNLVGCSYIYWCGCLFCLVCFGVRPFWGRWCGEFFSWFIFGFFFTLEHHRFFSLVSGHFGPMQGTELLPDFSMQRSELLPDFPMTWLVAGLRRWFIFWLGCLQRDWKFTWVTSFLFWFSGGMVDSTA